MSALPRFVLISAVDVVPLPELLARITRAPQPVTVLVRDKLLSRSERVSIAMQVLETTRPRGDRVWIAESPDIARELSLDGVHLGGAPDAAHIRWARAVAGDRTWVNVACHGAADVRRVAAFQRDARADSLFLSPIFETVGKGRPLGVGALREAHAALATAGESDSRAPELIALGGVDAERAGACFEAGAAAVAAIRRAPFD